MLCDSPRRCVTVKTGRSKLNRNNWKSSFVHFVYFGCFVYFAKFALVADFIAAALAGCPRSQMALLERG